jgi:two-component system sensor histidine kinase AgrC
VIWIEGCIIALYKGYDFLGAVTPLAVTLPFYICFLSLSKQKGAKYFFTHITVTNFMMLKSYVGFLVFLGFKDMTIRLISETLFFILLLFLVIKFVKKPYFKIQNNLDKGWGLLALVSVLVNGIYYIIIYSPINIKNQPVSIFMVLSLFTLMFVFYFTFYYNFESISKYFQIRKDWEMIQMQTVMQKKEYEIIVDKLNAIKIYRHDMKHHINLIDSFLHDNKIEEVQKYLKKLDDNLNKTIIEQYCENYRVNVILSSYINRAKNENIEVLTEVEISENIKLDNIELGLIFANSIENSINACKKIKDLNERRIRIVCKEHYNQLYIQISNTYIGEVFFDGMLPISTVENHGFGTKSIATIVDKYDGVYSFTAEDGIFKATAILKYD